MVDFEKTNLFQVRCEFAFGLLGGFQTLIRFTLLNQFFILTQESQRENRQCSCRQHHSQKKQSELGFTTFHQITTGILMRRCRGSLHEIVMSEKTFS